MSLNSRTNVDESDSDTDHHFEDALEELHISKNKVQNIENKNSSLEESLGKDNFNTRKDCIQKSDALNENAKVDANSKSCASAFAFEKNTDETCKSEETEESEQSDNSEFDEDTIEGLMKDDEIKPKVSSEEIENEKPEEDSDDEEEGDDQQDETSLLERDSHLSESEKEDLQAKAQGMKAEGNRLFKEGNYVAALVEYTNGLQTCPVCFKKERSIMYSNRAAAKLHMEKHEAAIKDCTKAIELNPLYMKALYRRAELYEKTEKLDEALADYQKILEMDPSQHTARAACLRLPDQIKEKNEKLKEQMMGQLKSLGDMVLKPFGLSTNNFKLQQDPNTGGYSVSFNQNGK